MLLYYALLEQDGVAWVLMSDCAEWALSDSKMPSFNNSRGIFYERAIVSTNLTRRQEVATRAHTPSVPSGRDKLSWKRRS